MSNPGGRLFVLLQHLLPKQLMTALVFRIARIRVTSIKNLLIRKFVALYDVDTEEAARPVPDGYDTFNDFFTRQLVDGARPVDPAAGAIVAPADGTLSALGRLDGGSVLQAKGLDYSLQDLLMTDMPDAGTFRNGDFATIYLAPYDYHRVHSPLDAELVAARYVPGSLYSVNAGTVSFLPGLFTRNERLVCHFACDFGPMILIFVGALHVGSISTPWTGQIRPQKKGVVQDLRLQGDAAARRLAKGDLLGWFNMGSTVIVLTPPGACRFVPQLAAGDTVRVGQLIGHRRDPE